MRSSSIAAPYMRASTGNSSLTACSEGSNRGGALHQWDSVSVGNFPKVCPGILWEVFVSHFSISH